MSLLADRRIERRNRTCCFLSVRVDEPFFLMQTMRIKKTVANLKDWNIIQELYVESPDSTPHTINDKL